MTSFDTYLNASQRPDLRPEDRLLEETLAAGLVGDPEVSHRITQAVNWQEFSQPAAKRFAFVVWPAVSNGRPVDWLVFTKLLDQVEGAEADKVETERFAADVFRRLNEDPPSLGLVAAYLDFFEEAASRRNIASMLQGGLDRLADPFASPAEIASDLTKLVFDLDPARRLSGRLKSESEGWGAYMTALEGRQRENPYLGLDTGFGHLNNVANGLEAGSLFVLAGMPSTGKTTFVKQLVDQVATANPEAACLFVSYEQSADELRVKTLSRLSGVENRDLLRGRLSTKTPGWKRVTEAAQVYQQEVADRVFILEADSRVTVERIRLAAQAVIRLTHCRQLLVAVDYLQIVPTDKEFTDPRSRVDAVLSDLKRLARDLKATVLTIASMGRTSYGADSGSLGVFKESGNIEYTADLAGVLVEDRKGQLEGEAPYPDPLSAKRAWKRVFLDIVKNRNGERARIHFDFYPAVSGYAEAKVSPEDLPDEAATAQANGRKK